MEKNVAERGCFGRSKGKNAGFRGGDWSDVVFENGNEDDKEKTSYQKEDGSVIVLLSNGNANDGGNKPEETRNEGDGDLSTASFGDGRIVFFFIFFTFVDLAIQRA